MKIYTKKGDQGQTSLLGGTRVDKNDLRIEAYGTVDELNAYLGHLGDMEACRAVLPLIRDIQHNLFVIGSHLANDPEHSQFVLPPLPDTAIAQLEADIDQRETELEPLKNFVLPGGHPGNSMAHIARCVCRRAERRIVALNHETTLPSDILSYLNRLSDWLFVLSRFISKETGALEVLWKSR